MQAEEFFLRALEREPQNARALTGLAAYNVLMAVQLFAPDPAPRLAKAESILVPLLDTSPAVAEPYAYMGLLEFARRRSPDATHWFERALEQSPSHAPAYAQLGRLLVGQGRAAEGMEHILYAMRLSPRDPSMAYWLGFAGSAQIELGDDAKSIAYLDRAVALHPTQPRTLLVLAAAHAMAGHMPEARRTLARVQKELPHLTGDKLIDRFFGGSQSGSPRLREGLRRAVAPDVDVWQSPPLPSQRGDAAADKSARFVTAIAVTPFKTFGEAVAISGTMTDDLTDILSRVPQLRVISGQTMRHYAEKESDAAKLSAELGVHYVLEGSLRPHGDKLRVNVALIDPANRLTVWTARIERQNGEQHTIQDEIVARIARELHFEVLKADSARGKKNPDLFDLSRRGWKAIFEHGIEGLPALERARAAFSEMLAREPDHWGARAGLGAYHTLVGSLRSGADWAEHLDKGEKLLDQAIRDRPDDPGSHFDLSIVQRMHGRFAEAVASLERCIAITPSAANCYAGLGHAVLQQGRAAEGIEHINYAMRLSPQDVTRSHWQRFAGEAKVELGHFDEAVALLRQSRAANPRQPITLRSPPPMRCLATSPTRRKRWSSLRRSRRIWRLSTGGRRSTRFSRSSTAGSGWRSNRERNLTRSIANTAARRAAPMAPERGYRRHRPATISKVPAIIRKVLPRPIMANGSAMKSMPVNFT
jgi:TolB-like protein/Tfp pilus assembly protein PilF